jgi:hypothetical protein
MTDPTGGSKLHWNIAGGEIAVALVVIGVGGYVIGRFQERAVAPTPPSGTALPSPTESPFPSRTSSPSPTDTPPRARVTRSFNAQEPAIGERYTLGVGDVSRRYSCHLHEFVLPGMDPRGAYLTTCGFLSERGYEVLLLYALLRNATGQAIRFDLHDFVLTSRDGSTSGPVNIRSLSGVAAANYIPENGILPPRAMVDGWLTFDARTGGDPLIPDSLSYIDRDQTLTIVFEGKHSVR